MFDQQEQVLVCEVSRPVLFNPKIIPAFGYVASVPAYELNEVVPVLRDDRLLSSVVHDCEPVSRDSLVRLSPANRVATAEALIL